MIDELLRPFAFEFFRNGLAVATLAGGLCGLVGVYIVVRGMSYLAHGLSHAIFGGFAFSSLLGANFLLGAGVWGVASALAINSVTRRRPIGADAAIGVITTASFALGLVLFALLGHSGGSFDAALFGSILGVSFSSVIAIACVTLVVVGIVVFAYRPLLFTTFDAEVAAASGLPTARIEALLMVVFAVSILVSMQVLGVMLIAAALVIPPTIARMLTHSFLKMLVYSTAIGAACGVVGMNVSYQLDIQSGPAVVIVAALAFLVVYVIKRPSGLQRVIA